MLLVGEVMAQDALQICNGIYHLEMIEDLPARSQESCRFSSRPCSSEYTSLLINSKSEHVLTGTLTLGASPARIGNSRQEGVRSRLLE
jgi:hypothetical protein